MHSEKMPPVPPPAREKEDRSRLPTRHQRLSKSSEMPAATVSFGTSRGSVNRLPDSIVSSAAADVRRHEFGNLRVGGMRRLGQQCGRSHDLPTLAISALRNVFGNPGLLQCVKATRAETFDGRDVLACSLRNSHRAGASQRAIDMDGACAAVSGTAAEFRAG